MSESDRTIGVIQADRQDHQTSTLSEIQKRQAIINTCVKMNELGINQGTSGNISLRHAGGLLITPTSMAYEEMRCEDIVFLSLDGRSEGLRRPSSEWRFHCDILQNRSDVEAIVHAHPIYASIISIMGLDIPALHYMVAVAGGNNIRCAPYEIFGSQELSNAALVALEGRRACLLANHGLIAVGSTLPKALWLAGEVETLAKQLHGCLQIGGPRLLSDEQITQVLEKIADYGHRG
jgi:L-fuculose-phosphate aldolase